jgi:hypothetical protein
MKHSRYPKIGARPWPAGLALLAGLLALGVPAQSNPPPGARDYAAFSSFITGRNIFDPNRQPHYSSAPRPSSNRPRNAGPPGLQLVGIMSYEKGRFAFFNGSSRDLKMALPAGGKIVDHTIVAISATEVRLESADKKDSLRLKIGEGLRLEHGRWVLADGTPASVDADATSETHPSGDAKTAAAPASTAEPNEVLKRLMQLREKENQ